ncbi:unnamed protein product [Scytosiphon promiscuus]
MTASMQDERSQHPGGDKSVKVLRSRAFEVRLTLVARKEAAATASAVGTGDRSEKIRTYDFPQDRNSAGPHHRPPGELLATRMGVDVARRAAGGFSRRSD